MQDGQVNVNTRQFQKYSYERDYVVRVARPARTTVARGPPGAWRVARRQHYGSPFGI